MIEFSKVNKWYGSFHVLKDCTTRVDKGEVVVVCGPSGSGKSTLIKCVNGLEPFQEGDIVVNGESVRAKSTNLNRLRSKIGMVFQHFELFPHMEGLALPAGNVVSPSVLGHDPDLKPDSYDPDGAKKLLAEAGYPNGFVMTLATPNNRYINDEQVAQACAQMFSRIGVTTKVDAMPLAAYLGKARNREFGTAMLGWGSLAADLALRSLAATPNPAKGWGAWNWARYSNPALDKLIDRSLTTVDEKKRELAAREASVYAAREVAFIPLHYQVVTWAMRRSLDYTPRTDEFTFAFNFRQVSETQEAQPVHGGAR